LLYILIYKQKYRLYDKKIDIISIISIISNANYRTTKIDNIVINLIKSEIYIATKFVLILFIIKKFLQIYAQNIVNLISLISYNNLYIDFAYIKFVESKLKTIKSKS